MDLTDINNFAYYFNMNSSRQLAAIMFTDIVGYTALMGRDEQKAFELLEKNRQIQKPIIAGYISLMDKLKKQWEYYMKNL